MVATCCGRSRDVAPTRKRRRRVDEGVPRAAKRKRKSVPQTQAATKRKRKRAKSDAEKAATTTAAKAERKAWKERIQAEVLNGLCDGKPEVHAAQSVGLHRATWWRWTKADPALRELADCMASRYIGHCTEELAEAIDACAPNDRAKHLIDVLKRRDRDHWRDKVDIDHGGPVVATLAELITKSYDDGQGNGSSGNGKGRP